MHRHLLFLKGSGSRNRSKSSDPPIPQLSHTLQFWLLLVFEVPSLICSLFIFYRYLSSRKRRRALHNHPILVIVMISLCTILTDVPWTLDGLRHSGQVWSRTPTFCLIWWFIAFGCYSAQTFILAWASIERHILIFHKQLVATTKRKVFYHYLPPVVLLIYVLGFSAGVIFLPYCENKFDFTLIGCGANPCYLNIRVLVLWETIVNSVLPTLIIVIFSIALLLRITTQKRRLQQRIHWRKYRRMSIQLLSLSAVYLFLNLPLTVFITEDLFKTEEPEFGFGAQLYIFCLNYSVTLLIPFVVCLGCLPDLKRRQSRRIAPTLTFEQHNKMYLRSVVTVG